MKLLKVILWSSVSVLGAVALAGVAGVFRPDEPVNGLWLVVAAACIHVLAYRFYGRFLARKVVELDDRRITPAVRLNDGKNFHPTNKYVLFGHHFAAIAGAGPLLGPVLAAQFGFLPGFLWLVIGAVLAGAVQDFIILVASMRRNGRSLPRIARDEISPLTGIATSISVLFIVIVALAGLGFAVVNALHYNPWGTFTLAMTIPIAFFMGYYLHHFRPGRIGEVSAIGVTLLLASVAIGHGVPGSAIGPWFDLDQRQIVVAMAIYGFFASILPVWMLLAPRDYLSTFMKIGVVALLAVGVVIMAPTIRMPRTTIFMGGHGPIIPGPIFPFVFITIACGAISGFHSLVSSGTTPKMIEKEGHALIGYGAMLLESFVGVIALVAACLLVPGDYFAINTHLSAEALAGLGFPVQSIGALSKLVEVDVAGRPGGAVSLAVGMASVFASLPGMAHLMAYWYQFALLFEAMFILTTIDAGTRVARYILQDIGGFAYPKLREINWLPGAWGASLIIVVAWSYFILTGTISTIWPMFGAANQLLGMLALCIGTTVLIKMGKAKYLWVTAAPMVFVGAITLSACYALFGTFLRQAAENPARAFVLRLDAFLVASVGVLAVIILADSLIQWRAYLFGGKPITTTEVSREESADLPPSGCC